MELIAFASGKGGTGKTLMASCLGYALIRAGHRVLMIDTDQATDGLSLFLLGPKGMNQISDFTELNTFSGLLQLSQRGSGTIFEPRRINRTGTEPTDHGVTYEAIISGNNPYGELLTKNPADSGLNQESFQKAVARLFSEIRETSQYDYVLVDTRGGFAFDSTDICALADSFIVVTDPDVTSFYQDRNLMKRISGAAQELGRTPVLRSIIVNRAVDGFIEDHIELNKLEVSFRHQLELEFPLKFSDTHPVPADIEVLRAYKSQRMPYVAAPWSPFSYATLSAFGDILKVVTAKWTANQVQNWNVLVASVSDAIKKKNEQLMTERETRAAVAQELTVLRKENADRKEKVEELQREMDRLERRYERELSRSTTLELGTVAVAGGGTVGKAEDRLISGGRLPDVTALHQLPAPPADFTGRAAELKELLEAVKTGGVTISGLQGMGGVGKTALALKLAELLKSNYPDAQFYVDLKGGSPQPLTARDALAHVVRAWHPTAQLPEQEAELAALYRSLLGGKRALLLMDNARDAQQVAPLVPPAGCLLLVTSRKHFNLPGLVEKNLDKLPPADARDLLLRIAPRLKKEKNDQVDELARLCGYLPLALRAVASALQEKRNIKAADYSRRLADARERLKLTETDAALQSSYELLSDDLRHELRLLSVFPDSFDLGAAAAVWDIQLESAQDALGELLAYSLADFDESTNRYRLHNLARIFVGQLLNADELNTAQKRHAGHYLHVLEAADALYRKGGETVTRGLAIFDAERTNIQAGHDWVVAHQQDDDAVAEWCALYPLAGVNCLSLRQHPREQIRWLESAVAADRRLKQRGWESAALGNLGMAYESLGEYSRAIEYQEQHLEIAHEIGDRRSEGNALGNLGLAYHSLGEYRRAIEYHQQSLQIARELGDRRGEASALGNLGNAYDNLGEHRRSIEYQERQLQIAREIGDRLGEGQALGNLGSAYYGLREYRRAIEYYEQRLQIAREIGDRQGEANALFNSAPALDQLGDRVAAIARAEAALKIYEAIEAPHAPKVRDQLAKWRGEDKAPGQGSAE
jgi:MinD-like ATPase involved in chromosome partitioning or flagellar assembly/tetratricopeptide (TPR) repeat protein